MFTKEQTIQLQQQTQYFFKNNLQIIANPEETEVLRNVLRFHEYRYYVLDDPLIADGEYDQLYKLFERTENAHPTWVTPDSPTQRVGQMITGNFVT
ncbi:MAG: DNA ligase LigA-related protein, partial [Niabella sp.]